MRVGSESYLYCTSTMTLNNKALLVVACDLGLLFSWSISVGVVSMEEEEEEEEDRKRERGGDLLEVGWSIAQISHLRHPYYLLHVVSPLPSFLPFSLSPLLDPPQPWKQAKLPESHCPPLIEREKEKK